MVTEGDAELRRSLDIDEYRPVLEVVETNWCGGNSRKWNEIGCVVTDGQENIFLKACYRQKRLGRGFLELGAVVSLPSWCPAADSCLLTTGSANFALTQKSSTD